MATRVKCCGLLCHRVNRYTFVSTASAAIEFRNTSRSSAMVVWRLAKNEPFFSQSLRPNTVYDERYNKNPDTD